MLTTIRINTEPCLEEPRKENCSNNSIVNVGKKGYINFKWLQLSKRH